MTVRSDASRLSTLDVAKPGTESFLALTVWPLVTASRSAMICGYGVQWQFVPHGTESPKVRIDHVREPTDAFHACDDAGRAIAPLLTAIEAASQQRMLSLATTPA
jgi:hypothetical protein